MYLRLAFILALVCAAAAFEQQPVASLKLSSANGVVLAADQSAAATEVVAFERKMEEAVVRGDVPYVDRILASDFSFTHGDGWTMGGKPLAVDDKAAFLARVAKKQYLVHDIDTVQVEMHGDIAITYGRYISLYQRTWNAVWFERVYAKRDGGWQFVSHRTVRGPISGSDRKAVE